MIDLVEGPIDLGAVVGTVRDPRHGAILVFEGVVRDDAGDGRVLRLSYEAWREGALRVLGGIADEIASRWPGTATSMVHRTGEVAVGEASLVLAVGSPHRAEAYEASRYALEEIKVRLPVWKKEVGADGSAWKPNAPRQP
jgi:MoaE-MoaD fusion protein